jgi:hypothetical protein
VPNEQFEQTDAEFKLKKPAGHVDGMGTVARQNEPAGQAIGAGEFRGQKVLKQNEKAKVRKTIRRVRRVDYIAQ